MKMWATHLDFLLALQMKGSSVSCCCNGVLSNKAVFMRGPWGREAESWADRRTCTERAHRGQVDHISCLTSAHNLQNKTCLKIYIVPPPPPQRLLLDLTCCHSDYSSISKVVGFKNLRQVSKINNYMIGRKLSEELYNRVARKVYMERWMKM